MNHTFSYFRDWWLSHPNWINFIYFALAILVALYTERARRILTAPVWFPIRRFSSWMKSDLDNQIRVLHYMHTDSFHLIHYLAYYLIHAIKMAFGYSVVFALLMMTTDLKRNPSVIAMLFLSSVVSVISARLNRLHFTLERLFDYDKSVAELEGIKSRYPPAA